MPNLIAFLQFEETSAPEAMSGAAMAGVTIVWLALMVLLIAAMWKVFEKAGEPGWAALIPIYNFVVLLKIAGKPAWWVVLMLIPFVNFIVGVIAIVAFARNFGKGVGFALGLIFLAPVFYPMLAWGDARYQPQSPATA